MKTTGKFDINMGRVLSNSLNALPKNFDDIVIDADSDSRS